MHSDYQERLNRVEATLAEIRAETVDVLSRLVERQSQIDAVDRCLANLDSQCSELKRQLARLLSGRVGNPELPENDGSPDLKTA
jgi:predicted nuclease with TOPRIM domain